MRRTAWDTTLVRLLDDVYTYVATGPHTRAGWRSDVRSVLRREVPDPRGWLTLDWHREGPESGRWAVDPDSFPFLPLSADELAQRLTPMARETAVRLLAMMTFEWQTATSWNPAAEADARTLLGRFGDDAVCYGNCRITEAGRLPAYVESWTPLTQYTGDAGFVVVAPEEVGVFWSFHPI